MFLYATQALLVAVAVATVASAHPSPMSSGHPERPEPCCYPDRWEAQVETADFIKFGVSVYVSYDQIKGLGGVKTYMQDGKLTQHDITDYSKNLTYNVQVFPTMTCKTGPIEFPYSPCLNNTSVEDLSYFGSATIGPRTVGTKVDAWSYSLSGGQYTVSVTDLPGASKANTCAPVLQTFEKDGETNVIAYLNVDTTIHDEDIFIIPDICKH